MGKQVKGSQDDFFVPDEQQDAGIQQSAPQDDFFVPDQPVKKKAGTVASSGGLQPISPVADFKQSASEFDNGYKNLEKIRMGASALHKILDTGKDVDGNQLSRSDYGAIRDQYNDLGRQEKETVGKLKNLQTFLQANYNTYQTENEKKKQLLFDQLDLSKEDRQKVYNDVFKAQNPDKAKEVDEGRLVPNDVNIDADDLAKMLTGKDMASVEKQATSQKNRTVSDRVFGSFVDSATKTLAFDLPASTMATVSNAIGAVRDKASKYDLTQIFKKIAPETAKNIDDKATDLQVGAFNWAKDWRDKNFALIPAGPNGIPVFIENNKNLVQSISQIKQPLDAIDFVFASAGQGAAQILPSIATSGITSYSQEIGHNYLDGVQAIADKLSKEQGKTVTPEDVIREGKDEGEIARNYGIVQGALEAAGAKSVASGITKEAFGKNLREKSLSFLKEVGHAGKEEFLTEGAQSALQQISTGKMTGLGNTEAVKNIDWYQVLDESIAGAIGGMAVSSPGQLVNRLQTLKKLKDTAEVEKAPTAPEGDLGQEETPEARTYNTVLDAVIKKAKDEGDPRSEEEIKKFVQDEFIDKIINPEKQAAASQEQATAPVQTEASAETGATTPQEQVSPAAPESGKIENRPGEFSIETPQQQQFTAKEKLIAERLVNFPSDSFARFGDRNFMAGNKSARFYLNKKGIPIDVQAQDMSYLFKPDGDGNDITPQDIVDFVQKFPNPKYKLTVMKPDQADDIAEQIAPHVESNAKLLYALEAIDKHGISAETLGDPAMQEILNNEFLFDKTDRENVQQLINYGNTEEGRKEIDQLRNQINGEIAAEDAGQSGLSEVQTKQSAQAKPEVIGKLGYPQSWDLGVLRQIPPDMHMEDLIGNLDKVLQRSNQGLEQGKDLLAKLEQAINLGQDIAAGKPQPKTKFNAPVQSQSNGSAVTNTTPAVTQPEVSATAPQPEVVKPTEKAGEDVTPRADDQQKQPDVLPVEKTIDKPGPDTAVKKSVKIRSEIGDLFKELDKTLNSTLSSGLNPEAALLGAKIVGKYIELGVTKFAEIAADVYQQYGEKTLRDYFKALKAGYGHVLATEDDVSELTPLDQVRAVNVDQLISLYKQLNVTENDTATTRHLESDSTGNKTDEQVGAKVLPNDGGTSNKGIAEGGKQTTRTGKGQQGSLGLFDGVSTTGSTRPDTGMAEYEGPRSVTERPGRGADNTGGSTIDESGVSPKPNTTELPQKATGGEGTIRLNPSQKLAAQNRAERIAVKVGDTQNIAETLPFLMPHQLENVLKAEKRFFQEEPNAEDPKKGILFTDGTGTGKTYTGLGIVKRMMKMGKVNGLIVAPTDAKVSDWIQDAKNLFIDVKQLDDTKDKGLPGLPSATTYANFRQNEELMKREFDWIIYDECHKIVSNQEGSETEADRVHKIIANAHDQAQAKAMEKFTSLIENDYKAIGRVSENTQKIVEQETKRLTERTKVVFLSATPFSYHKNLDYADGFLWNIQQSQAEKTKSYDQFYVKNLGYRIRYNKLTMPETGVDQGLMERQFHTNAVKSGAISSTRLQLDKDYSREFVLVDDKLGLDIDEGFKIATTVEEKDKEYDQYGREKPKFLPDVARKKFSWLYQNQLLESIKAKHSIPRIQEHLALGRKVVVFHGYVNNLPSHPFDFSDPILWGNDTTKWPKIQKEINDFHAKYPQYQKLDLSGLTNPIDTLKQAFGDKLAVFNGTVSKTKRKDIIRSFNDDTSGKDVIIVQMEAGKEGISLHDITGEKERALMNLGLPYKPTDAIQTEGRIYRIGQMSDAIVEYFVLHTNFEKNAFASKINERIKTAENLAFGEQARNLEDAFKEGYKNPIQEAPNKNQGKGGKDADMKFDTIDEFQKAITFYIARGKRNSKTKAREGEDYYASPEPVGLKMVEWLGLKPSERFLEPSAGHGAIARWAPGNTTNKFIEPSYELRADLAINSMGDVIGSSFEQMHINNKFDGIAMNPPYGHSGKTAMEHFKKAMDHLADGGRVIAILPDGPSMDKRLNEFFQSKESEGLYIRKKIQLPTVTFERAGTSVSTQILVVDSYHNPEVGKKAGAATTLDLRSAKDINELFDEIKDLQMPERLNPEQVTMKTIEKRFTDDRDPVAKTSGTLEQGGSLAEIKKAKHTKTGKDLWIVKLNRFIESTDWHKINVQAKSQGGSYSSYKSGDIVPGWIHYNEAGAQRTLNFIRSNFQKDAANPSDPNSDSDASAMVANPSKGKVHLHAFETRVLNGNTGKPFKLYKSVITMAKRFNPNSTLGQGYNTKGALGTFYRGTKNIRLTGLNDVSVAFHELAHALDLRAGTIRDFIKSLPKGGNNLSSQLTNLYVQYYPKAQPAHALRIRMIEGYATLLQKYVEFPTAIKKDYPQLVKEFLEPGGQYYTDDVGLFLDDAEEVVKEYQALSPLDKASARIMDGTVSETEDNRYPASDKVTKELFDILYPVEKMFKRLGKHFTTDDISLWIRLANNAYQIATKNISSKTQQFWAMDSKGRFKPKHNFNYLTIVRSLERKGLHIQFAAYLYARRIHFEYEEMNDLQKELDNILNDEDAYVQKLMADLGLTDTAAEAVKNVKKKELSEEIKRLSGILENESFSEDDATMAYNAGSPLFQEQEEMFDKLVAEDLEFAHNDLVQLLDDEGYKKFKARKGHATFKRAFYDELVGEVQIPTIKGSSIAVGQFMARRGSTKPVLNPLIGAMMNHGEIMRKGMRQMVNNKFLEAIEKNQEFFGKDFEIQQLKVSPDATNRYPQTNDDNIIMARKNYKRVPILASKEIAQILHENFDFHNVHLLEKIGIKQAQLFRQGTTGVFFQFFLNNTLLDQISAFLNSRNGMIPFVSSMRQIVPAVLQRLSETQLYQRVFGPAVLFPNSLEAAYLKEYMFLAGTSQTFLSADIESRKTLEEMIIGNGKTYKTRLGRFWSNISQTLTLGNALKVLALPGNASEIMTRGTEYILARKAGKDQVQALEEAGRVSGPFHHMGRLGGSVGRSYVRSVPYFNAAFQIFKQTKDTISAPKSANETFSGKQRYAFAALAMVATAVSSCLYILDQDDDDEQKRLLKSLGPDILTKYLFLPNPYSNTKLIQIRVPEQLGWLAGLFNMMLIEGADQTDYSWSEYGEAAASWAPQQLNPFNPLQALFSYAPPAPKAIAETAMGKKTFPGVRDIESQKDQSLPPELRYNDYTSPVAIKLGQLAGLSPKKIDHLLEGTFGRSIKYVTGKPGGYSIERVFARELYFEASRQVQYYYDIKERVTQDIKADEEGMVEITDEQRERMFEVSGKVSEIEANLEALKIVEESDQPTINELRSEIFKKCRELEKMKY